MRTLKLVKGEDVVLPAFFGEPRLERIEILVAMYGSLSSMPPDTEKYDVLHPGSPMIA